MNKVAMYKEEIVKMAKSKEERMYDEFVKERLIQERFNNDTKGMLKSLGVGALTGLGAAGLGYAGSKKLTGALVRSGKLNKFFAPHYTRVGTIMPGFAGLAGGGGISELRRFNKAKKDVSREYAD